MHCGQVISILMGGWVPGSLGWGLLLWEWSGISRVELWRGRAGILAGWPRPAGPLQSEDQVDYTRHRVGQQSLGWSTPVKHWMLLTMGPWPGHWRGWRQTAHWMVRLFSGFHVFKAAYMAPASTMQLSTVGPKVEGLDGLAFASALFFLQMFKWSESDSLLSKIRKFCIDWILSDGRISHLTTHWCSYSVFSRWCPVSWKHFYY